MRTAFFAIVALVGLIATGCGAGAPQATPVAAHGLVSAPFVQRNATQAAGAAVVAAGKAGVTLRVVPDSRFGLMVVLKNRTHRQLVLEDVRAVVPHGSFVRQLGTHLAPFFQCKPFCPRHIVMHGPFGAERPVAFQVHPLRSAQAQLDFAFAGCGALQNASTEPITHAIVVYRNPNGRTFRETIALTSGRLNLPASSLTACRA